MDCNDAVHHRSLTLTTSPSPAAIDDRHEIEHALQQGGFARLEGEQTFGLLGAHAVAGWAEFAASWNDLGNDLYMADGGRYRRRRHAAFLCVDGQYSRKPHQPHYQSRDYNRLNGDVQRWFDPVLPATMDNPAIQAIFDMCLSVIATVDPTPQGTAWHSEMHQFRIETKPDHVGRPTPEGLHRDGVDWVFVMLVCRNNVRDGITEIGAPDGTNLGRFLLQNPGDAVLLDDRRILHGVTEIHAVDPDAPAYRDVLVVTFVRQAD